MPLEKASVEDLKKDQEKLKSELQKLQEYMGKKKETPKPSRKKSGKISGDKELLEQHLEESKRIMEKFDYLIDVLLEATEETGEEDLEKAVYTLAESQSHALDVLASVKSMVEKTSGDMPSKTELEEFEEEQKREYNQLNEKVNLLIEKVEKPPYLKELDAIRVAVSNIQTELEGLEEKGLPTGEVREKTREISKKVDQVEQQVRKAPAVKETPEVKSQVDDMSAKVDELERVLKSISKNKRNQLNV